jgi:GT2 family glycosyltransferase
VVVVNYNGAADLPECLQALAEAAPWPPFEVVVVDNASTDASAAWAESFAATHPDMRVLRSDRNRGYAGGLNVALPHCRGAYVAVLNADMVVSADWLVPLVEFLDGTPEAAAVNPLILLQGNPERINAAGQDVHVTGLGFNRALGRPRSAAGLAPTRVSGVQGGAVVIRRAVLDQMGGWDESGFLYHEDVELSWLLQLLGYDLYCVPASVVRHKYHLSMYPGKLFLLERNRWAMLCANLRPTSLLLLAPWLLFTEAMMWAYCLLRGRAFLRAKAGSYRWVWRQRPRLQERHRWIAGVRRRRDTEVLARLRWAYAWKQFAVLGRERGVSGREPEGGLSEAMRHTR